MPELSILVATSERRRAFWSWLVEQLLRQEELPSCEVVICGPPEVADRLTRRLRLREGTPAGRGFVDIRTIPEPPRSVGFEVPAKRNALLEAARGRHVAWMDDDDWHYPARIARSLWVLQEAQKTFPTLPVAVVGRGIRYLDLASRLTWEPRLWENAPIPVTIVGAREALASVCYDTTVRFGSDTIWLRELSEQHRITPLRTPHPPVVALRHDTNMSPWLRRLDVQRFGGPYEDLGRLYGSDAWEGLEEHLDDLAARLETSPT